MGRLAVILAAWSLAAGCAGAAERPRLVVLISIDQFRADYLTRFEDLFLPATSGGKAGGFRYLMERGAWQVDAHHDHLPTATGPGHAVLLTGAPPYKTGVIGNDWWDYSAGKPIYCVQDDSATLVGGEGRGVSARNLKVTTLGDELKMATGGQAKVFGIALKDRAAVLMAGHMADGVYWYDSSDGKWVTSRAFRRDGTLPGWMQTLNAESIPSTYFNVTWTLSVPASVVARLFTPTGEHAGDGGGLGPAFPHVLKVGQTAPNARYFKAFASTPFANEFVFRSALRLAQAERLGQDDVPDILAINLASNDYLGHNYGVHSQEALDITVRTDRMLSSFLNELAARVPGGLSRILVALSADHGAAPNPAAAREAGLSAGIWQEEEPARAAQQALERKFGPGKYLFGYIEPYLWLNRALLDEKGIPLQRAERIAADAAARVPGIYAAYTRADILAGRIPHTDIGRRASISMHPQVGGDVLLVSQPGFMPMSDEKGTTHGEAYSYDTRVPILMAGPGIRPGVYAARASTMDIAPTLAFLLHVTPPSGSEGHILPCAEPTALLPPWNSTAPR